MGGIHRVAIAPELFHEARRYMVEHDLPTVRSAVEAMIEAQSCKEPGAPVIAKKLRRLSTAKTAKQRKPRKKKNRSARCKSGAVASIPKMGVTSPTELPAKEGKDEEE